MICVYLYILWWVFMIRYEKIIIFMSSIAIIVITKLAFDWFRRSLTRSGIFGAIFGLPTVQVPI